MKGGPAQLKPCSTEKSTDINDIGYDIFSEIVFLCLAYGIIKKPSEYSDTHLHPLFPFDEKTKTNKVGKKDLFGLLKRIKMYLMVLKQN